MTTTRMIVTRKRIAMMSEVVDEWEVRGAGSDVSVVFAYTQLSHMISCQYG